MPAPSCHLPLSSQAEYKQHQLEPRGPVGPAHAPYNPAPFEGQTHYR